MDLDSTVESIKTMLANDLSQGEDGEPFVVYLTSGEGIEVCVLDLPGKFIGPALESLLARFKPHYYVISLEGRTRLVPQDDYGLELRVRSTDPELLIVAAIANGGASKRFWVAQIEKDSRGHRSLQPWRQPRDFRLNFLIETW